MGAIKKDKRMSHSQKVKGVILAGGTGSRLYPLTKVTNKHLLPVGEKPMLFHSIEKLKEAGVDELLIVTGTEHMGAVVSLLGSGAEFDCQFTYKVQDQAGGIAEALSLAKNFTGDDRLIVILGDNVFEDSIKPMVDKFRAQEKGCRLLLKEVHDPERFGVAEMNGDKIISIEEKPSQPKSNCIVTGIYAYDQQVFEFIDQCERSARGELEVSDVNQFYVEAGCCEFDHLSGWWTDAGTHSSLQKANQLVLGQADSA